LGTSSIVTGTAVPALSTASGTPARIAPSRSRVLLRVAPLGFSAVAIGRPRGPHGQFLDRALASAVLDSPCQGSRTGLTPPISTSVPSTPATALALRARPSRRHSGSDPPSPDQALSNQHINHRELGPLQAVAVGPSEAVALSEQHDAGSCPSRDGRSGALIASLPQRAGGARASGRASADGPGQAFPRHVG
jgi:hypothetical protein